MRVRKSGGETGEAAMDLALRTAKDGGHDRILFCLRHQIHQAVEVEMIVKENLKSEDLNLCFMKEVKMKGGAWKDILVELLMQILSLVDDQTVIIASQVCSGWRDAVCFGLTRLSLSWCGKNMNNMVLSLAPKFTNLQTLIVRQDKPQLEDNAVETIAKFCRDLQILDLSKSFKLTDRSLYAIANGCSDLTKLNISGRSAFSDNALAYLASLCRKLKILSLCGCHDPIWTMTGAQTITAFVWQLDITAINYSH